MNLAPRSRPRYCNYGILNPLSALQAMRGRRFTIRSLLIVILACGIAFAAIAFMKRPRAVVQMIERNGGRVLAREALSQTPTWLTPLEWAFGRLRRFEGVTEVRIRSDEITDEHLEELARLPTIERIEIRSNAVTDDGLLALGRLTRLLHLHVRSPRITDRGLAVAGKCGVSDLEIESDNVTGSFLSSYEDGGRLGIANIHSASFDDRGFEALASHPLLYYVDISGSAVTDAGLESAARIPMLARLDVSNTRVTPGGVEKFRQRRPDVTVLTNRSIR